MSSSIKNIAKLSAITPNIAVKARPSAAGTSRKRAAPYL